MSPQLVHRFAAVGAAALALVAAGCGKLDPITAPAPVTGQADFTRYVAIGTSVSMGIQNGGLVDEFQIRVAPMLLGGGVRLLEGLDPERVKVESTRVAGSPAVAHLKYRVVR